MTYIKHMFFRTILLSDNRPSLMDKLIYTMQLIGTFAPITYLLNGLSLWFTTNHQFASFILICLFVNMVVGAVFHTKMGSFDWVELFKKNILVKIVS